MHTIQLSLQQSPVREHTGRKKATGAIRFQALRTCQAKMQRWPGGGISYVNGVPRCCECAFVSSSMQISVACLAAPTCSAATWPLRALSHCMAGVFLRL